MRPSEVLDHQGALLDYTQSLYYESYLEAFLSDMGSKNKFTVRPGAGAEFAHNIATSLRVASAFHVQADMTSLIRAAAADLDDTDHLVHERLPAEHGFLVFEDGWLGREIRGRTIVTSAIQWWHGGATVSESGKSVPGMWLILYTDVDDERDEVTPDQPDSARRMFGRYQVHHIAFYPYGRRVGPFEIPAGYYADYVTAYPDEAREPYLGPLPNDDRMIVALFRLLSQVIVEVKDHPLDRSALRRARRMNLPQRVQTIALRRKETRFLNPSEPEPGSVEWQHSWVVRGHWAWRKCGAEHPLAEPYEKGHHARVYVAPFIKGPLDMPLRVSEKVWDLSR